MILRQILPQGRRQCIRLRLLEEAVLHLHHLMAAGPIKAHPAVGGHRVLALIAVAQGLCGAQDFLHGHVAAAQSGQGILNPLALGPQLLGVVQMAEVAAAAAAIVGTVRLLPVGGGAMAQDRLAEGHVFQHLHHQNVAVLAPDGVVDEHHLPVDAGHAQPLAGVALDGTAVYMIFLQCGHSGPPLMWESGCFYFVPQAGVWEALTSGGPLWHPCKDITDSHGQFTDRPWESCIQKRIPWCRGHAAQQRPVSGAVRSQR